MERGNKQVTTLDALLAVIEGKEAAVFVGPDRSGKSVLAKKLQTSLTEKGFPSLLIKGEEIRNADLNRLLRRKMEEQFDNASYPLGRISVLIDDFDECSLPDRIKEALVEELCRIWRQCIIFSFSNAPCVLFASKNLPEPSVLNINPFTNDKLLLIVRKWKEIGVSHETVLLESVVLPTFQQLQMVFDQTEIPRSPSAAVTFLELIETSGGADIAFSSFAACYDTIINNRLHMHGVDWRAIDECKNFLSLVAYRAYAENGSCVIKRSTYEQCISTFEEKFLSEPVHLRRVTLTIFLREEGNNLAFVEEYLWFFLCARYVANELKTENADGYREFVVNCIKNIFEKKFANIVIFIAYFSSDNYVLESLLSVLDGLFSKADDWVLSDDTRELMLGVRSSDALQIESHADVEQNRMVLLREKIFDIINDAVRVVARYTLPFLHSNVADSAFVETVDIYTIDADSYMRNVNALLRTHSVIGQILTGRSGTYSAALVLDCITRMVKASGRYVSLNHAIATVLLYDQEKSREEVGRAFNKEDPASEEQMDKVIRIFSFWSVYLSHAGLARYLSQEHSIRALKKLAASFEGEEHRTPKGNQPYNFTVVMLISQLYERGGLNRRALEDAIEKYGEHSTLMNILRVVFHIYTYYMPISIEDKQWLSAKLKMSLSKLEVQRVKATDAKRLGAPAAKRAL